MKFKDKVVVVTGAASGIGRAITLGFATEGAIVVASDINDAQSGALTDGPGNIRFQRCDVTSVADIEALMAYAAKACGGIDIVINNAGAPASPARIDEISVDEWDHAMKLLLRSVAMGIRHAVPHMLGRAGAAIVNIASVAGHRTGLGPTGYSVAKAGVLHLTKLAAADLARHAIRVNAISPGLINTNIFAAALDISPDRFEKIKQQLEDMSVHAQPVARPGQPEDIASMALFLASDDASFITGADMLVDGGVTMGERRAWDPLMPGPLDMLKDHA